MRFLLVVHSLIILLHQHNAGQYLAIRKIQKLCFYDSRLKYTKIWNENIWKEHSRRKWTPISAAAYIIIILTTLFLLFLPPLLILLLFSLLQGTEIDVQIHSESVDVCLNLNKCTFSAQSCFSLKYKFDFFCYWILPANSFFDSTTFVHQKSTNSE